MGDPCNSSRHGSEFDGSVLVKAWHEVGEVHVEENCPALLRQSAHAIDWNEVDKPLRHASTHNDHMRAVRRLFADFHDDTKVAVAAECPKTDDVLGDTNAGHDHSTIGTVSERRSSRRRRPLR